MNERIRELKQQATRTALWIGDPDAGELDAEKFAELIVLECLSVVKSNTYGPNGEYDCSYSDEDSAADRRARTIYEEIAYRFGVAE